MPPPYRPRHARGPIRCQHCERDIELTGNGVWVDSDGLGVCVKYTGPLAIGETTPFLLHTPMPVVT
jgi:hypothetical protein